METRETTYHIEIDDIDGTCDALASFISGKRIAIQKLREFRERLPDAYLVKCVQTRYRPAAQFPKKKGLGATS